MNTNSKVVFDASKFSVREPTMFIFPHRNPVGDSARFSDQFGFSWKKIPNHPNHRFIGDAKSQVYVTLWMGDEENPPSVAIYHDMEINAFKEAFLSNNIDPSRSDVFTLEVDISYAGGVAMQKLKEAGLWK
jgi:hypothetical protein